MHQNACIFLVNRSISHSKATRDANEMKKKNSKVREKQKKHTPPILVVIMTSAWISKFVNVVFDSSESDTCMHVRCLYSSAWELVKNADWILAIADWFDCDVQMRIRMHVVNNGYVCKCHSMCIYLYLIYSQRNSKFLLKFCIFKLSAMLFRDNSYLIIWLETIFHVENSIFKHPCGRLMPHKFWQFNPIDVYWPTNCP